tara:strand:- start:410 stop:589 length:180 start_codon:yes stop_codon:yes gene_type:complete
VEKQTEKEGREASSLSLDMRLKCHASRKHEEKVSTPPELSIGKFQTPTHEIQPITFLEM